MERGLAGSGATVASSSWWSSLQVSHWWLGSPSVWCSLQSSSDSPTPCYNAPLVEELTASSCDVGAAPVSAHPPP